MGISFKISKKGARYQPKAVPFSEEAEDLEEINGFESSKVLSGAESKVHSAEAAKEVTSSTFSGGLELPGLDEYDVSFTLNLFEKGYTIRSPTEAENSQLLQDGKSLHPYDRASETMFSAIQMGCLPGDIFDDIPSKYIKGTLVCEVRDYRRCLPEQGTHGSTADGPIVNKVRLRMTLENVVKDIPLLSDDSWTYSDLMEVEARVVKALQPQLNLDPTPNLDRLHADSCTNKLNLGIIRKRPWQTPEVTVTYNGQTHGKKVCIDGASGNDNCKLGDPGTAVSNSAIQDISENDAIQHVSSGIPSIRPNNFSQESARSTLPLQSQAKFQAGVNFQGIVHGRGAGSPANFAGTSSNISSPQTLMGSYNEAANNNVSLGKRENQETQIAAVSALKRSKQTQGGLDGIQQQQLSSQSVALNSQDINWKNQLMHSQLDANGNQCTTFGGQRFASNTVNNVSNQDTGTSFYFNQHGVRYGPKEEQIETERLDAKDALQALARESNVLDQQQSRSQHLLQQSSIRNHLPPLTQWSNSRAAVDKDTRKDEMGQKRKMLTSPRVSSGPMVQSPVSSKSGEISSGSVGQFSAVAANPVLASQKTTANSNAVAGTLSATSSPNDSVHRQPHVPAATKRKSNSANKTQAMSGVGSPASVSNINAPLNASSPSIGTAAPMGDQIERFTKIDIVTQRYEWLENSRK
ncbi:uncharacterized protein A4U43_C03F13520 [Asparagus officinalis]|uniref:Spt20-like SEP domain-containing protein n=1 Tax=Asparagus officinalis TaxID=4686 RepID=A0A5P1F9T0_ASPOF|nr:uncharacterized protein A4U43_C03F13520 [Asparagus officinalis]